MSTGQGAGRRRSCQWRDDQSYTCGASNALKQSHLQTLALVRKRTCRGVSPLKGVGRISMTSCQAVPADLAARTRTAIAITSHLAGLRLLAWPGELYRSEERRVGKECVSTCKSRWSLYH